MKVIDECLNGVKLLEPVVHSDDRGFFIESYSQSTFHQLGISFHPVQDNHSLSKQAGTLRGLHFQLPPFVQAKLVRVLRGAIYDVVVDIRPDSSTFGKWYGYHVSSDNHIFCLCRTVSRTGFAPWLITQKCFIRSTHLILPSTIPVFSGQILNSESTGRPETRFFQRKIHFFHPSLNWMHREEF